MPDISVSLDIEIVKIVCVFNLAKVWTLQSLDDLRFHHPGNMSRQQRQQETLLRARGNERKRITMTGMARKIKENVILSGFVK